MKKVAIGLLVGLTFLLPGANVHAGGNEQTISTLMRQIRMLQKQIDELQKEQEVKPVEEKEVVENPKPPRVVPPKIQNGGHPVGAARA